MVKKNKSALGGIAEAVGDIGQFINDNPKESLIGAGLSFFFGLFTSPLQKKGGAMGTFLGILSPIVPILGSIVAVFAGISLFKGGGKSPKKKNITDKDISDDSADPESGIFSDSPSSSQAHEIGTLRRLLAAATNEKDTAEKNIIALLTEANGIPAPSKTTNTVVAIASTALIAAQLQKNPQELLKLLQSNDPAIQAFREAIKTDLGISKVPSTEAEVTALVDKLKNAPDTILKHPEIYQNALLSIAQKADGGEVLKYVIGITKLPEDKAKELFIAGLNYLAASGKIASLNASIGTIETPEATQHSPMSKQEAEQAITSWTNNFATTLEALKNKQYTKAEDLRNGIIETVEKFNSESPFKNPAMAEYMVGELKNKVEAMNVLIQDKAALETKLKTMKIKVLKEYLGSEIIPTINAVKMEGDKLAAVMQNHSNEFLALGSSRFNGEATIRDVEKSNVSGNLKGHHDITSQAQATIDFVT